MSMPGSLNEETILNVVTTPGPGLRQASHLFLIVSTQSLPFLTSTIICATLPLEIRDMSGASAIEYSCAHGAQINLGDLTL